MVSRSGQTLFRLASSNPASLSRYRVERLPFIFQRVLAPYSTQQTSSPLSSVAQNKSRLSIAHRSYATTTEKPVSRPKAHTGRTTSKPRKTTSKGTQTKITGEVKKATKPKTTEPKAKPKARKATKAAKPKRKATRTPRTRTPEQVEDAKNGKAVERYKNQIKKLKEKALKPPHGLPSTAFIVISSELSKNVKGIAGKDASARYKTLSAEELEVNTLVSCAWQLLIGLLTVLQPHCQPKQINKSIRIPQMDRIPYSGANSSSQSCSAQPDSTEN